MAFHRQKRNHKCSVFFQRPIWPTANAQLIFYPCDVNATAYTAHNKFEPSRYSSHSSVDISLTLFPIVNLTQLFATFFVSQLRWKIASEILVQKKFLAERNLLDTLLWILAQTFSEWCSYVSTFSIEQWELRLIEDVYRQFARRHMEHIHTFSCERLSKITTLFSFVSVVFNGCFIHESAFREIRYSLPGRLHSVFPDLEKQYLLCLEAFSRIERHCRQMHD